MNSFSLSNTNSHRQEAERSNCLPCSESFIEFKKEETEQSIPDRFRQIVKKYPDRIAVKCGTHTLTYHELNSAANRVAHALLAQGNAAGHPVALIFEHGIQVIVALLGVLKAGKIYVPLDSLYPSARLKYMLEDSQAQLVVTNNKNLSLAIELSRNKID